MKDDLEKSIDYIMRSHPADLYEELEKLTPEKIEAMGQALLDPDTPLEAKERVIAIFAHTGIEEACNYLEQFVVVAGEELQLWAELALGECRLFMGSGSDDSEFDDEYDDEEYDYSNEKPYMIDGVVGEHRFTYYFLFMLEREAFFTPEEEKQMEKILPEIDDFKDCRMKEYLFVDDYLMLIAQVPYNLAVEEMAQFLIKRSAEINLAFINEYFCATGSYFSEDEMQQVIAQMRTERNK